MDNEIICYKGSLDKITTYIYDPISKKVIRIGEESVDAKDIKELSKDLFDYYDTNYRNFGEKVRIKKKDFDKLYDKCIEKEKLDEEIEGLTKILFEKKL
jgi:hypothetical protein